MVETQERPSTSQRLYHYFESLTGLRQLPVVTRLLLEQGVPDFSYNASSPKEQFRAVALAASLLDLGGEKLSTKSRLQCWQVLASHPGAVKAADIPVDDTRAAHYNLPEMVTRAALSSVRDSRVQVLASAALSQNPDHLATLRASLN